MIYSGVDLLITEILFMLQSPSSITSWDYVEGDSGGVKWIPDHAVTHCVGCGGEFWAARRKHHCRYVHTYEKYICSTLYTYIIIIKSYF